MRTWLAKFLGQWNKRRLDTAMEDEIAEHLALAEQEFLRRGMTRAQARLEARRSFGAVEPVKEQVRQARGIWPIETLAQDLRYGLRTLRRAPGFTAAAVLTLGLGIGATTAVFSIVHAVLLRSLPYPEPERLLWIASRSLTQSELRPFGTLPDFVGIRERARSLSSVVGFITERQNLVAGGQGHEIHVGRVSAGFLDTLGVPPMFGRGFSREHEVRGRGEVILLSHGFWQRMFGADPGVVGRTVLIGSQQVTVLGVLPPEFAFPDTSATALDALRPMEAELHPKAVRMATIIARLAPGVSREQAQTEVDAIGAEVAAGHGQMKAWKRAMLVEPLHERLVERVSMALLVLQGAVVFVLWICCLNVANLMLARCAARHREIAIRGSLGAERWRVMRQLLTESALLAGLGCLAGVALAVAISRGLVALRPVAMFQVPLGELNLPVAAFAIGVSAFTAIAFGLMPAFSASRTAPMNALRAGPSAASISRSRRWTLGALVSAQLALTLMLLVGAGLMLQSFRWLRFRDLGFRSTGVLVTSVSLDRARYPDAPRQKAFFDNLLARASALPGVESAALSAGTPPADASGCATVDDAAEPPPPDEACVPHQTVTPGYFATLGIPLVRGRIFDADDAEGAVVNSTFVRAYLGPGDPIGKRFKSAGWHTVAGVAADAVNRGLAKEPRPHVYVSKAHKVFGGYSGSLVLRISTGVDSAARGLRGLMRELDPQLAVSEIQTIEQVLTASVSRERFLTWVLTAFAALSLLLGAVGVYGVVSYVTRQRRLEMGVRLALGAQPRDLLRQVLGDGAKLTLIGALAGVAGAIATSRLLGNFLFQVNPTDWRTFALAAVILGGAALLACYFPARQASRADPLAALRHE